MHADPGHEQRIARFARERVFPSGERDLRVFAVDRLHRILFHAVGQDAFHPFRISRPVAVFFIVVTLEFGHHVDDGRHVAEILRAAQRDPRIGALPRLEFDRQQVLPRFQLDFRRMFAVMDPLGGIAAFERVDHRLAVDVIRHEIIRARADRVFAFLRRIDRRIQPRRVPEFPLREKLFELDQVRSKRDRMRSRSAQFFRDAVQRRFLVGRDRGEHFPFTREPQVAAEFAFFDRDAGVLDPQLAPLGDPERTADRRRIAVLQIGDREHQADFLPLVGQSGLRNAAGNAEPLFPGVILKLEINLAFAACLGAEHRLVARLRRQVDPAFQPDAVLGRRHPDMDPVIALFYFGERFVPGPRIEVPRLVPGEFFGRARPQCGQRDHQCDHFLHLRFSFVCS